MQPILSIGITSYKRLKELERCINSVQTKYADCIEIIVSEDCSPLSKEIGEMVNKMAKESIYPLHFMPNERNLGYDCNLGEIMKKCRGKYVFLMSDDDSLYEGFLDILIPFLKKEDNNMYGVIYAPFIYDSTKRLDRYRFNSNTTIEKGESSAANHIYDSILFSGLIFRREWALEYDASRFVNMNYFQVYLFLKMLLHKGGFYFSMPSVVCVGDGENAYGIAESSGGNPLLANRKSVISDLEFNKTLIKVINIFDTEEGTNVFKSFEKQYSLHCYSGLAIARKSGITYFKQYWNKLNNLDIKLRPFTKIYYWTLLLLGSKVTNQLTYVFRKLLRKESYYG